MKNNKYYSAVNSKGKRFIGHSLEISLNNKMKLVNVKTNRKVNIKSYRNPSKKELKDIFKIYGCLFEGYERYLTQIENTKISNYNRTPKTKRTRIKTIQ